MKVKLYKTNECPWCEKVMKYLEHMGVEYEIKNCSENEVYRDELITLTRQSSVPVVAVDDKFIIGFDKKAIDVLFKLQGVW